jgi:hypothetical protein
VVKYTAAFGQLMKKAAKTNKPQGSDRQGCPPQRPHGGRSGPWHLGRAWASR